MRKLLTIAVATALTAVCQHDAYALADTALTYHTATPIKHLVVIFQENVSFDHYFGTYPNAQNLKGETPFYAAKGTPTVNGVSNALLSNNATASNQGNGSGATNPFRLSPAEAATNDQDHGYTVEQQALHSGIIDAYPQYTGAGGTYSGAPLPSTAAAILATTGTVMGYFDGNTVTAMWNYAQHFALSDNSYDTNFGPSTPGAINLISGQTNGVIQSLGADGSLVADGNGGQTLNDDADPVGDVCSGNSQVQFGGQNIGDLLNAANITWGFFEGGFALNTVNANGSTGCGRSTTSAVTGVKKADYIPHHQPFQYYTSTANPTHARPSSVNMIGRSGDAANHQYDLEDFFAVAQQNALPAVSYLKASGFQDGHAGYSDPIDEQAFITQVINYLQSLPSWNETAVIINYDDSDGWYDHQMPPIVNQSTTADDALTGAGACGDGSSALAGITGAHAQGRCGYGPRLPLLVISPYAKSNYVDHALTDQTSILRFIEDNWLGSQRIGSGSFDAIAGSLNGMFNFTAPVNGPLILDQNGQVVGGSVSYSY
jgi:phospholipase C